MSDGYGPRRSRGEAQEDLLDAAVATFNEKGYSATTREIADRASVSEALIFRYFTSKAGLFRQAMIVPFEEFVTAFAEEVDRYDLPQVDAIATTRHLIGGLYDLFVAHRSLVALMWSAATQERSALVESGIVSDAWASFDKLEGLARRVGYGEPGREEIATRAVVFMIAGMAVAGSARGAPNNESRDAEVDEIARICLHGYGRLR